MTVLYKIGKRLLPSIVLVAFVLSGNMAYALVKTTVSGADAATGIPVDNAEIAHVAASASPAGTWVQLNPETKQPEVLIKIEEKPDHSLSGKITKVLDQSKATTRCESCPDDFNNKPILGMQILWGLQKMSDYTWENGQILSPKRGKVFSCNATLSQDGQTLMIRIYSGAEFLGSTQTWYRSA